MPPKVAEAPQPLSQTEREQMEKLLARASLGQGPAARIGEPYIALTNISVPRRGDPDHQSDLVSPGETVYLTPDEAAQLMRHGPKDGRQIAVIRPASGPGSTSEPLQRIPPRAVSGQVHAPPPPPEGSDMPRPDPPGSSRVVINEPPEAAGPVPGSENTAGQDLGPGYVGAEDILPSRTRQRGG